MPSALLQHFWSTSAQGLHIANTHICACLGFRGGGAVNVLGEREVFSKLCLVCFNFIHNTIQKTSERLSSKLSSDTKGQPVVLLPRYNWIHCELSYLECSLCLYVYAWMAHLQIRTSLCNTPRWRLFLSLKGFSIRGWKVCKPMLSVPGAVHYVAGDFKEYFCLNLRWISSTLSFFCKCQIKQALI